jgi:hypothetical protein
VVEAPALEWQGQDVVVRIDTLEMVHGVLPRRAQALVIEWALAHRAELSLNWRRIELGEALLPIAPLE